MSLRTVFVRKMKSNLNNYSGFGLVLGAAIGTLFFVFTQQAFLIGVGAGLGLVLGSVIGQNKKE